MADEDDKPQSSDPDYKRGKQDGKENSIAADPRPGPVEELVFGVSDDDIERGKNYDQGRAHGKDEADD